MGEAVVFVLEAVFAGVGDWALAGEGGDAGVDGGVVVEEAEGVLGADAEGEVWVEGGYGRGRELGYIFGVIFEKTSQVMTFFRSNV